jgi:chemotaxis protein MotB
MNYTAERHFVPPHGSLLSNADEAGLPWEDGDGSPIARHDTWLLSFIDILALLLTLFVLLLAYQDSEMKLAEEETYTSREFSPDFAIPLNMLGQLFQQQVLIPADLPVSKGYAMPGEGLLPVESGAVRPDPGKEMPDALVMQSPEERRAVPVSDGAMAENESNPVVEEVLDMPEQEMSATITAPRSSENTVEALLEVFETSELRDKVEFAVHPGEVNLEISDSILFARASAALTNEGLVLLKDLGVALSGQPYILSVEGHTDNIPIETAHYPSNWELSSARAAVVTRKLIEQGIAPDRVRAIGYGATRPLADNSSAEGRARNRRVSFILQVDVKEDGQSNPALSSATTH